MGWEMRWDGVDGVDGDRVGDGVGDVMGWEMWWVFIWMDRYRRFG